MKPFGLICFFLVVICVRSSAEKQESLNDLLKRAISNHRQITEQQDEELNLPRQISKGKFLDRLKRHGGSWARWPKGSWSGCPHHAKWHKVWAGTHGNGDNYVPYHDFTGAYFGPKYRYVIPHGPHRDIHYTHSPSYYRWLYWLKAWVANGGYHHHHPLHRNIKCPYHQHPHHQNPHSHTHGNPHSHTHGNPYSNTHGNPHSNTHGNPYSNTHGNPHSHTHGNPYSNTHGNPYSNTHGNPHSHTHGNPYSNTHGTPYSNTHGNPHHQIP